MTTKIMVLHYYYYKPSNFFGNKDSNDEAIAVSVPSDLLLPTFTLSSTSIDETTTVSDNDIFTFDRRTIKEKWIGSATIYFKNLSRPLPSDRYVEHAVFSKLI